LLDGLEDRGLRDRVDVIVTTDHGMANTSANRVIVLDDYIDLSTVDVVDWSPVVAIAPPANRIDEVYQLLVGVHPNLKVYKKQDLPAYLNYGTHDRVPAIIGLADEGWSIASRQPYQDHPEWFEGATHGYDHTLESMKGVFVADGPSFKDGAVVPAFQSIHLYALMSHILGLTPAPNDGAIDSVRALLRPTAIPATTK
jgi:predicted AlkP superfamily pyrophosphatase or phosphodiesterase